MIPNHVSTPSNTVGAITFFSYIFAALAFTGIIINDVWSVHRTRPGRSQQSSRIGAPSPLRLLVSILSAIASFSTLSYHMLNFLFASYSGWSHQNDVKAPTALIGAQSITGISGQRAKLQIWRWATSSTLFQDFAEAICADSRQYFWTQKALLYSFVWNWYMAEEGQQASF